MTPDLRMSLILTVRRLVGAASLAGGVALAAVSPATSVAGAKIGAAPPVAAAATKASAATKPARDDWPEPMDYGPFLTTSVSRPAGKPYTAEPYEAPGVPKFPVDRAPAAVAAKGIVIPVGPKRPDGRRPATVCFDTDTLAMAGWTGGWLDLSGTMFTSHKGTDQVTLAGTVQFRNEGPGWSGGAGGREGSDPRPDFRGPLPAAWGRYDGLYVHGDRVILAYHVGSTAVSETPGYEGEGGRGYFTRTIRVAPREQPTRLALCTVTGERTVITGLRAAVTLGPFDTAIGVAGTLPGAKLVIAPQRTLWLVLPASREPSLFKVLVRGAAGVGLDDLNAAVKASPPPVDPSPLMVGGPKRYKPIGSVGVLGGVDAIARDGGKATNPALSKKAADPAFVVDTLTLPTANPSNAWLRLTGLDFFADGRAAVCTLNGDVWVVSGIDDQHDRLTWTRFATGLYQPMGLKVVDDVVYVRGKDQITKLHDLNGDGEADFYENFNNEGVTHPSYHGFAFDLQTDPAGNFYYARGGLAMDPTTDGHGRLMRLSKDGKTATPIATGLRAPNGVGAGPGPWVLVSDNQGNWVPTSQIHLVDPAAAGRGEPLPFLGYLPHHHQATPPTAPARPLVFVPYQLDNSSGGACFVSGPAWGPYQGQWVHTSFGAAAAMLVLPDASTPAGQPPKQAAIVRLPVDFPTGVMRPRFNPRDGQLYVAGVGGGWQTKGTADGGLYRLRHTGKPGFVPTRFAVVPGGVWLTFPQPLDKAEATDPQNYAVERWNYKWTEKYGSPDYSVKTPGKAGHDEVEVKAVELSEGGRTVTLRLAELVPVDQLSVQCHLKTAGGTAFEQAVYATVNVVPQSPPRSP